MSENVYKLDDVRKWAMGEILEKGRGHAYDLGYQERCLYVHSDSEDVLTLGCIIGHMIVKNTRMTMNDFMDMQDEASLSIQFLHYRMKSLGITFTPKAVEWMCRLQCSQDNGMSWGSAVDMADRIIKDKEVLFDRNEDLIILPD